MKKREVLAQNRLFKLIRQRRDHKVWYEIQLHESWYLIPEGLEDEIANYFGKTAPNSGLTWRFWNRIEAQKQFTYTALKWC